MFFYILGFGSTLASNFYFVIFRLNGKLMMGNAEYVETHGMAKGRMRLQVANMPQEQLWPLISPVNTSMLRSKLQPTTKAGLSSNSARTTTFIRIKISLVLTSESNLNCAL